MQVADVRNGLQHHFAIGPKHDAQHAVCRRMLRPHVDQHFLGAQVALFKALDTVTRSCCIFDNNVSHSTCPRPLIREWIARSNSKSDALVISDTPIRPYSELPNKTEACLARAIESN